MMPLIALAQTNNSDKTYNEDNTNIVVTAKQPQFTIHLKSNPTTGYSWFLREYDSTLVQPIKHNYIAPTNGMMGASGVEDWIFKMKPSAFVVPQTTTLRMFYARPWESTDSGTMVVFRVSTQASSETKN